MQKQNKLLIAIFSVIAILSVLPMVSAAAITSVINSPTNYTNATGTMVANCTTSAHIVMNVTFYANSTTSTNHTIGTITNTSADQTAWYNAVMSVAAQDGTDYDVTCYADNGSDQVLSNAHIGMMFDSTDPICNITREHGNIEWKGTQSITWDSSDAIERVTTAVTIDGPEDQTSLTDADASEVRTLTSQDTKYVGDWNASMVVTDRAGNTCSASTTFKSFYGEVPEEEVPVPIDRKGLLIIGGILAVIAYFYFKKD